jgi:hypothetical protein
MPRLRLHVRFMFRAWRCTPKHHSRNQGHPLRCARGQSGKQVRRAGDAGDADALGAEFRLRDPVRPRMVGGAESGRRCHRGGRVSNRYAVTGQRVTHLRRVAKAQVPAPGGPRQHSSRAPRRFAAVSTAHSCGGSTCRPLGRLRWGGLILNDKRPAGHRAGRTGRVCPWRHYAAGRIATECRHPSRAARHQVNDADKDTAHAAGRQPCNATTTLRFGHR